MTKKKKQKVRFHKGDKKPPKTMKDLHYIKKMIKVKYIFHKQVFLEQMKVK